MRFRGLDLNLLVALDALLETRSVSRAAERLNLSQPAMSAALGRLRDYLGDDLLTVQGKKMFPTAYAETLIPQLKVTLRGIEAFISTPTQFDPTTSQRSFEIVTSDYIFVVAIAPLTERLAKTAPGISLHVRSPDESTYAQLDEGKVDLLLTPEPFMDRNHPADLLFEESHVIAGWERNPFFEGAINEDAFYECGQVMVEIGRDRTPSFADRQLALRGRPRKIEVTASSFTIVPWLLRGSMRLSLMHGRLAAAITEIFPIRCAPLPFDFPSMREMVQYHRAREKDQGILWLRRELAAIVRT